MLYDAVSYLRVCPEQLVIYCAVSSDTLTLQWRETLKLPSV